MSEEEGHDAAPSLNASLNAGSQLHNTDDFDSQVPAQLGASTGGTGGGMQVFGIGKDGISRAIIKFLTPPKPQPLTVCFHFPGAFLLHKNVIAMFKSILMGMENADITSVQFVDRNVTLGTRNLENRWLITVNNMAAREKLINTGITIVNKKIAIRPYDDILAEEYLEFHQYIEHQKKMGLKTQQIQEEEEKVTEEGENGDQAPAEFPVERRDSDDSVDSDILHENRE